MIVAIPHQEGRGKQLAFKLSTLHLQDKLGLDTVQAAALLTGGHPIDVRTYAGAIAVLHFLGCTPDHHFNLLTNNPRKLKVFEENSFSFTPVQIAAESTEDTERHLNAKQRFLGHRNLVAFEA